MTGPGSVFCHNDFVFFNGQRGKKLFVVLCTFEQDAKSLLVCRTTSKGERYPKATPECCGFPYHDVYAVRGRQECFGLDTWIQFDEVHEFRPEQIDEALRLSQLSFIGDLKPVTTRAVLNCALKSEDIEAFKLERIRRTLKSLQKDAKGSK